MKQTSAKQLFFENMTLGITTSLYSLACSPQKHSIGSDFKLCRCCSRSWETADLFVADSSLTYIGIQDDSEPEYVAAAFLCSCGTTLYIFLQDLFEKAGGLQKICRNVRWQIKPGLAPLGQQQGQQRGQQSQHKGRKRICGSR